MSEKSTLLPCPFCGGEASDRGHIRYSRALPDTNWIDGSPITEAFFCNCISCGVTNQPNSTGWQTREQARAAWNRRTA